MGRSEMKKDALAESNQSERIDTFEKAVQFVRDNEASLRLLAGEDPSVAGLLYLFDSSTTNNTLENQIFLVAAVSDFVALEKKDPVLIREYWRLELLRKDVNGYMVRDVDSGRIYRRPYLSYDYHTDQWTLSFRPISGNVKQQAEDVEVKPEELPGAVFSALDLLKEYIAFCIEFSDKSKWNLNMREEGLSGKETFPGAMRLKQLQSLMQAYNIQCDIAEFDSGIFIEKSLFVERLQAVLGIVFSVAEGTRLFEEGFLENLANRQLIKGELTFSGELLLLFRSFLQLRLRVSADGKTMSNIDTENKYPITCFGDKFLSNACRKLDEAISHAIGGEIDTIDRIISALISPKNVVFTRDELVQKFGYPQEC